VSAAAYGAVSDVVGEDDNGATGVGGSGVAVGSGASGGAGAGSVGPGGTQVQVQAQGIDTANAIIIEGEELVQDEVLPCGKRHKRCTSNVWHYFTKKKLIKEANGKTYLQVWAHCNQPGCKDKARAEGNYGTTGFLIHLRTAQSLVKGQLQLKSEKDAETNMTLVQPYKYDEEASLKKFYLAIIMHEYPFNISEHEYFVEFIKSLRPSFPIKSRVTIRKEIMNMFLQEKEKLYDYFKTV
jgi:hypothetical protein